MKININLGCKHDIRENTGEAEWINVDKFDYGGNTIMDLNKKWGFPENYADFIWAHHILEHLNSPDRFHFFREAYRVLKPQALMEIHVPHKNSASAFDIAHSRQFSLAAFKRLTYSGEYNEMEMKGRFKIVREKLRVSNKLPFLDILPKIFSNTYYELLFPCSEIEVVLKKVDG